MDVVRFKLPGYATDSEDKQPRHLPVVKGEDVANFALPYQWYIITQLQDTSRHRLCILFLYPGQIDIKLVVFPDWNSSLATVCDTGLTHVRWKSMESAQG